MKQQAGFRFGQLSMSAMAFLVFSLFLLASFQQVRGGCSRFGHSCFGAHGKRAELPSTLEFGQTGLEPAGFGPIPRTVPDYYPSSAGSNGRVSPYLLEWLIAAHRADARGSGSSDPSKEELLAAEIPQK